jgi:hypothetical protein
MVQLAVISKSLAADEAASDRATYDVATSWRAPDIGIFIEQLPFPEFHKQPGQVPTVLAIDTVADNQTQQSAYLLNGSIKSPENSWM